MVIHSIGEHQWEDIKWDGEGHHTCINMELGTYCRLLYPDMVIMDGRRQAVHSCDHWVLKQYTN
jgi:hypothetical protein